MKRRYFFLGFDDLGDTASGEVEAEDFDAALELARELARQKQDGRPVRITTLTEQPDLAESGPIARALSVDFHPRFAV